MLVGKHFLLFPRCFQKPFFFRIITSQDFVVKSQSYVHDLCSVKKGHDASAECIDAGQPLQADRGQNITIGQFSVCQRTNLLCNSVICFLQCDFIDQELYNVSLDTIHYRDGLSPFLPEHISIPWKYDTYLSVQGLILTTKLCSLILYPSSQMVEKNILFSM